LHVSAALAALAGFGPTGAHSGDESYRQYVLTLRQATGLRDFELHLHWDGNGFSRGWGVVVADPQWAYRLDASGLKRTGDVLSGKVVVRGGRSQNVAPVSTVALTGMVDGVAVRGSFASDGWRHFAAQVPPTAATTGGLAGVVMGEAELVPLNGIAPGRDYPCLRGNNGAVSSGLSLVDDFCEARVQWRGEDDLTAGYYNFRGPMAAPFGGYASPIVYDGRVYAYCFEGRGEPLRHGWVEAEGQPADIRAAACRRSAQDVLVCVDAVTGRTLWKHADPDGPHPFWQHKAGGHTTPCADGGRVFLHSCINGKVKAFDARSGRLLWTYAEHANVQYWKRVQGQIDAYDNEKGITKRGAIDLKMINHSPQVAEGVVMFDDGDGRFVGLDAATGVRRWEVPDAGIGSCNTIKWIRGGKAYFLTGTGKCIEPATGRILWRTDRLAAGKESGTVAADENYFVTYGDGRTHGMRIYRATADSVQLAHELPVRYTVCSWMGGPAIYEGHAYGLSEPRSSSENAWRFFCANLATGRITYEKAHGRFAMSYFPVAADGRLFGQELALFAIAPDRVTPIGRNTAPGTAVNWAVGTSCAYADGRIFFRGYDCLLAYDMRRPAESAGEPRGALRRKRAEAVVAAVCEGRVEQNLALLELGGLGAAAGEAVAAGLMQAAAARDAVRFRMLSGMASDAAVSRPPGSVEAAVADALRSGQRDLVAAALATLDRSDGWNGTALTNALYDVLRGSATNSWPVAARVLCDMDPDATNRIVEVLSRHGSGAPATATAAIQLAAEIAVAGSDVAARAAAARFVAGLLDHADPACRRAAVRQIGRFTTDAAFALPRLRALRNSMPEVRRDLQTALELIDPSPLDAAKTENDPPGL
jgi:outer membrane protein assembly factor BamB